MAKKATAHDAQIILQLYDLRREAEMRKARHWYTVEFWPQSADEFLAVANAFPGQENAWMRQVNGYWDMAAALVVQGALHEELFLQGGISGEMFFLFAKIHPFLKEIRQKMGNPDAYMNIETVATGTKLARKRLERFSKNVEARRKSMAKPSKAK
ncbi:MAG TPA: hypothetical protein VNW47_06550 [Terriglobales bacterium]|jgi:hypothetical protein|nr:hypothetical protein [Terriglobales bacterium]